MAQGITISRDEAGKRLDSLIEGEKAKGANIPIRVGERTLVRYLATRSAFQGRLGADSPVLRDGSPSLRQEIAAAMKNTPQPPPPERSEGIEPHELAQQMNPDQMGEFFQELMKLRESKKPPEGGEPVMAKSKKPAGKDSAKAPAGIPDLETLIRKVGDRAIARVEQEFKEGKIPPPTRPKATRQSVSFKPEDDQ